MPAKSGWEFWIDDNGRVRQFIVGDGNEATARTIIQSCDPNLTNLNVVSKRRIRWDLIKWLGLDGGNGMEFVPRERGNTLRLEGHDQGALVGPDEN
jgi:hypothetical protein